MGKYYSYIEHGGHYVQLLMHDPVSDGVLVLAEYPVPGSPHGTADAAGYAFRSIVLMPQVKSRKPVKAVMLAEFAGEDEVVAAMDLSLPPRKRKIEWFTDLDEKSRRMVDDSVAYAIETKKQNLPF